MVTITYDAEKTNVKKLQAGFNKFSYEAEFVKRNKEKTIRRLIRSN